MSAKKGHIRVTVVAPGPNDGASWYRLIRGPGMRPKRVSCRTTDRTEAERMAREQEARMNAALAPRRGEDPLVMTVYGRHVAFREGDRLTAKGTVESYKTARKALAVAFADVRASSMTAGAVVKGQRALIDLCELDPSTANTYMHKLAHAWRWAHKAEHSGVGPWPGMEALPEERTRKRQLTNAEAEAVLREAQDYAGGRFVALFCLLSESGARVGEALALRGRDVDRKAGSVMLTTPKTRLKRRTRTIHLSPEVMALLPERRPNEWVFRAVRNADKPLSDSTVTSARMTIMERAGLSGEPLDLHSFRRYVVRKLHSAGVPLKDAMDYVGHDSVKVHLAYMHDLPSPEKQRDLLARAKAQHDPIAALTPGQVTGRVGPGEVPKANRRNGAESRTTTPFQPSAGGLASHGVAATHNGSGAVGRRGVVVHLSRDARAARLRRFLVDLAPSNRALLAEALQAGPTRGLGRAAVAALREFWPELLESKPVKKRSAARGR